MLAAAVCPPRTDVVKVSTLLGVVKPKQQIAAFKIIYIQFQFEALAFLINDLVLVLIVGEIPIAVKTIRRQMQSIREIVGIAEVIAVDRAISVQIAPNLAFNKLTIFVHANGLRGPWRDVVFPVFLNVSGRNRFDELRILFKSAGTKRETLRFG